MTTATATLLERLAIDGSAVEWALREPRSIGVAWATCPRGDWLLDIAARLGLDRRVVVRATHDCVGLARASPRASDAPTDEW